MNKTIKSGPLLRRIDTPADLRRLSLKDLPLLCDELRQFIIDHVSIYGGHFGANLGTIEMTVALHYVFDTPSDQLVWDVGHQAYAHKILTGRKNVFHTNRLMNGLSGFPRRSESEYDTFGVGHSSTSISAALGMALASLHKGQLKRRHIAVIGDGAMTAGMAFEGMNHAGATDANLMIVLNDNCMSIDPNVGALKEYLTSLTLSPTYNKLRDDIEHLLSKLHKVGDVTRKMVNKIEHSIKGFVTGSSNLFEALNLRYFGPVDGHDVGHLVRVFKDMKTMHGPRLLHCLTVKGKGFEEAEANQTKWHAPGTFDKWTGKIHAKKSNVPKPLKYQEVFGHTLVELARQNTLIVGITPAMPSGSSMNVMMAAMPDRAFDVGIAEQHAVTLSAGLATQGLLPYCNIYSTFMQRAYDQVIHDVCVQDLQINFCLDRGGLVGADGATHHGAYDIAYLRCLPNTIVSAPMDDHELRHLMHTAQVPRQGKAFFIRYPRGTAVWTDWQCPFETLEIGKGRVIAEGQNVVILSIGAIGQQAVKARQQLEKDGIQVGHYDMRFVKPIDEALIQRACKRYDVIITLEDGCLAGGFGSAVLETVNDLSQNPANKNALIRLGIPDRIIEHGTQTELYRLCGYDADAILRAVMTHVKPISGDVIHK